MDSEPNSDTFLASQYALRVALQTMKERCIVLQRRLSAMEVENQELRERIEERKPRMLSQNSNGPDNDGGGSTAEMLQLRLSVAELNRQKQQLNEHINMVSNENRKLWSRLSQIAKEKNGRGAITNEQDYTLDGQQDEVQGSPRSGASQNLIRSKTFTQHSPNPNLRHKLITDSSELSMEEVELDAFVGRGELMEANNDFAATTDVNLGFAYPNVIADASGTVNNDEAEFSSLAKRCMEGLQEMRREALQQQQGLNSALTMLESRIALQPCTECATKNKKPEMADKSLETDESFSEMCPNGKAQVSEETQVQPLFDVSTNSTDYLNVVQEKIKADALDRLCPMCGKIFASTVPFQSFQQHVEVHFIDESSEVETSLERNYEFISHTVGDF